MQPTRREFVRWVAASGLTLALARLSPAGALPFEASQTLPGPANAPLIGRARIDGVAKVTGAKLYASDFRAADMEGWPATTAHALLVRTPDASHVYEGLNLDALPPQARPTKVVGATDVAAAALRAPPFYAGDLFCLVG